MVNIYAARKASAFAMGSTTDFRISDKVRGATLGWFSRGDKYFYDKFFKY